MKKKTYHSILAGFLAIIMFIAQVLSVGPVVNVSAATLDGIYDTWELKNPTTGTETVERTEDGKLHFVSGSGNNNGNNPAVIISKEAGEIQDGFVQFTVTPNTEPSATRFGVYLRYKGVNDCIFVGYDAGGWFWQVYDGNTNPWFGGTRKLAPVAGSSATVKVSYAGNVLTATVDGTDLFGNVDISGVAHTGGIGFKAGTYGTGDTQTKSNVVLSNITYTGQKDNSGGVTPVQKYNVTGKVIDAQGNPISNANVALGSISTKTAEDGAYTLGNIVAGTHEVSITKAGYATKSANVTVVDADVTLGDITLDKVDGIPAIPGDAITSDVMKVVVDKAFPRVIQYELLQGEDRGKRFYGQTDALTTMKINGCVVTPVVESTLSADKIVYTLTVKGTFTNAANKPVEIDAVLTAELKVVDNIVEFRITKIQDNKIVQTIEFPNQNLISVRSTQTGANLQGANMSTNTHVQGDREVLVNDGLNVANEAKKGYMYAFVSDETLSAGLWSNSENNVTSDWQSVTATSAAKTGYKEIGLSSTYWTYQKTEAHRKQDGTYEMDNGQVLTMKDELPCVKVVIASDVNGDEVINWQDGAVEYRKIMNQLSGAKKVPELVAYRIAMNFGSQAQNPFLMTLDNVKKIYLHTDGLGQSILLKGYGSEGHDSGHLNYADIGMRIGGAEDMKTLLEKSKSYGATFGIHVNASETYPESKYFTEDRLLKNANGTYSYGWNWIDQGININADYDLRNGRAQRFYDLYTTLGGANNNLDFIYVDVWGNGQSGDNGTWASSQLSKEIKSLGWRVAGEWGYAMANESTFQHWAADLTYGGYALKGINSTITRFLYNDQKDSWIANFPNYGGAAEQPLLGGYNMKDFEGWQGRSDYAAYVKNLYNVNVPSKFLQHYDVMTWKTGTPVSMTDNSQTYNWTPDMQATLKDDNGNTIEINRLSNDYANQKELYRSRSIKYNDVEILRGSESNQSYLIPWFWDQNGKDLAQGDQKLYHWNTNAGNTTWTLPREWENVSSVKMYELSDLGKKNEVTVPVTNGKVTLTAKAQTPYVLHKGTVTNPNVTWSEGMHIVDSGFNSGSLEAWTGEKANANVVRSQGANPMLAFTNVGHVTQELTDLTPGQKYAVLVGVDNRSDAKAYMKLNVAGTESINHTNRSIARNYIKAYAHNTNQSTATVDNTSYFQNMYLFFTAPQSGKVTLTLGRESGDGISYFDDIRVTENESNNFTTKDGRKVFTQDFETVAQGVYPFVLGNIEGVEDNRTHLSEKHAPYTQVGWNDKEVDDVIAGKWSVKTNGLTRRQKLVYQTVPQNFRFEPGKTYNVSFKYEAGSDNIYALAIGDGDVSTGKSFEITNLPGTVKNENNPDVQGSRAREYKFMLEGSETGQTWFGIYSTATDPVIPAGKHAEFGGYKDFILDNLVIEEAASVKTELGKVITDAETIVVENYSKATGDAFKSALASAKAVYDNFDANQEQVDTAKALLISKKAALVRTGITVSGTITDNTAAKAANVNVTISATGVADKVAKTDANGNYAIHGVAFGSYTITVDSKAYVTTTDTIKSENVTNADLTKNFTVTQATTSLTGVILANNKPVSGAVVAISATGVQGKNVTTNAKGEYSFTNIVVKDYTVSVTKDGYDGLTVVVPTTKANVTQKNLMIQIASAVDYFNDFSTGVTGLQNLMGNTSSTTISSSEGGARISFPGGHTNVVEEVAGKMKDGVMEADVTAVSGAGNRFGVLLRANNMNSRIYLGAGDTSGKWFAEYWKTGGNQWSDMFDGPTFNQGEKVHLKAEVVGQTVKLWVNDQLVINVKMDVPMDAGYVGFTTRNASTFLVDNVSVTSYDSAPEGTQTISGDVLMSDNSSSEGAKVELKQGETLVRATTVGSLGAYKFKKVPYGTYTVVVSKGEKSASSVVEVKAAEFYVVASDITINVSDTPVVVDKKALKEKIALAETLVEADYTKESFAVFAAALANAKKIDVKADATQTEVNSALATLTDAISKLVKVTVPPVVDRGPLKLAIEDAKKYQEADYTKESFAVFTAALANAKAIDAKADATQTEVNSALATLTDAISKLVKVTVPPVVDREPLKVAIEEAKKYKAADYTKESFAKLEKAIADAKKVYDSEETTEKAVESAIANLKKAVDQLEKIQVVVKKGWIKEAKGWMYYIDNEPIKGKWFKDAQYKGWFYFNKEGIMLTKWQKIEAKWYYLGTDGKMLTGWQKIDGSWYLLAESGRMLTGWQKVGTTWYYLASGGKMLTGWQKVSGEWYYLNASGKMLTGWFKENGTWYYLANSGKMAKGWVKVSNNWYYMQSNGAMKTGWVLVKGYWYYLQPSGKMATGWTKVNGKTYFLSTTTGAWHGQVK